MKGVKLNKYLGGKCQRNFPESLKKAKYNTFISLRAKSFLHVLDTLLEKDIFISLPTNLIYIISLVPSVGNISSLHRERDEVLIDSM